MGIFWCKSAYYPTLETYLHATEETQEPPTPEDLAERMERATQALHMIAVTLKRLLERLESRGDNE